MCTNSNTAGGALTRHVHHPAVADSQDLVGLAEQATGADAVRVVSWELLLAGGAAVPPGLGQVGQLSTQRFIRPRPQPPGVNGLRRSSDLLVGGGEGRRGGRCAFDEEDLPSAPDMKRRSGSPERRRSPAGGCREARPDCGSEHVCRPPGTSRLRMKREHRALQRGENKGVSDCCLI